MQVLLNLLSSSGKQIGVARTSWNRQKFLLLSGLTFILFFMAAVPDLRGESDFMSQMGIVRIDKTMKAPDFTLSDIKGDKRNLSDFNQGFVMLNFWATW